MFRMTRAGTPPTTDHGGTSLDTTALAAITEFDPMVVPETIVAFAPTQTLSPIEIGDECIP